MTEPRSILQRWGITETELTALVDENPSLRGIMLGYVAEKKFHDSFLEHPDITEKEKDDDHDRKKKGDRRIIYKGTTLTWSCPVSVDGFPLGSQAVIHRTVRGRLIRHRARGPVGNRALMMH